MWRDRNTDEVKTARRHTDYAYDLATEPAAAKEVRLFGLAPWLLERFTGHRLHLHDLQYDATRLREKSLDRRAPDRAGRQRRAVRRSRPAGVRRDSSTSSRS